MILKQLNFNIDLIDKNDKKLRNTKIGYMMKNNPQLTSILRLYTKSLVDNFININNIKEENIIIRAYDGLLLNRPVTNFDNKFTLIYYQKVIISQDRKSYIAINDNETSIKGISNRYDDIDQFYKKILKINFSNKRFIFESLNKLKNNFYNSYIETFCVPSDDNKYEIILKDYGKVRISESIIRMLDDSEIDKECYFNYYLKPFFNSIVIEYI